MSDGPLEEVGGWPDLDAGEEPPAEAGAREATWTADHDPTTRDTRPAIGARATPAGWQRAAEGARVALARVAWGDARWSYLFKRDTRYAAREPAAGEIAESARRMRGGASPEAINGPFIKPPVWTWEVALYFWTGGVAAGSSFVALACDTAGDPHSAAIARRVALGAVLPAPLLLIADLGRPERFLNMLRIFKPRSPMSLGAWCLSTFSAVAASAVGADLLGRPRAARALGGANAIVGGYLGSYTGVLLASTAVPVWARSRLFLGPIFVATATATGAAATRLTLVARGLPRGHPTRTALGWLESAAILTEVLLSGINERRLGRAGEAVRRGRPRILFRAAEAAVASGFLLRLAPKRTRAGAHHLASALYLAGGLAFRFAWLEAGKASARDDEAVVETARERGADERRRRSRVPSAARRPLTGSARLACTLRRLLP